MTIERIIIRLDAGGRFGLGHLSRCISLINTFQCESNIFIIKSDNRDLVEEYIRNNLMTKSQLIILDLGICQQQEIEAILDHYLKNTLLIVDHYDATESYQKQLYENEIQWLQLDSHARVNFYANWVMHGSPGATKELYAPLRKNPNTQFLLGTEYCIIKEQLFTRFTERRVRRKLSQVIICFGGGDDKGATLACLNNIDFDLFKKIEFNVLISRISPDYESVILYQSMGFIKVIESYELTDTMIRADLAIIAPGMMSYESAFLGLPMLLVTIADNQVINSKAWEIECCALNVGTIESIAISLNKQLLSMNTHPELLIGMSRNCLNLVDGKGIERIINKIRK